MDYTVDLTVRTKRPMTRKQLLAVAQIGGVAVGNPGGDVLETTLTAAGAEIRIAIDQAITRITERVEGEITAVEAITTVEADRRLEASSPR